jgi:hypothetical protein
MAVRGRKPRPTHLKLVTGNPGKRPLPRCEPQTSERPRKPRKIHKRAGELWDEVAVLPWLTAADSYKLYIWCELQAEFEKSPTLMVSARIAQLRAVGSELGLDPASRARLGAGRNEPPQDDPAAKYFTS